MKTLKKYIDTVLLVIVLLVVSVGVFRPQAAQVVPVGGVQYVSLNARTTVQLNAGDYVNCPTYLIRLDLQNGRCAPIPATRTPAPSATSSPTTTEAIGEATSTATEHAHDTATPPADGELQAWQLCHEPGAHLLSDGSMSGVHSHEDCPPLWADWFSEAKFGHRVIYGGNETTGEMEWMHKHFAFTGTEAMMNYSSASTADDVLLFARRHRGSVPVERRSIYHSYEYYALDRGGIDLFDEYLTTGNAALIPQIAEHVSFWQGWDWCGTARLTHHEADELADQGFLPPFRIFTSDHQDWENKRRSDSWYCTGGRWSWDNSWVAESATTFHNPEAEAAMTMEELMDIANWELTGATELGSQRSEFVHCAPNNPRCLGSNTMVGGFCAIKQPIANADPNKQPRWTLILNVNDPLGCPDGYLWQYVAPSFPKVGVSDRTGNTFKDEDLPGEGIVDVPN